MSALRPALRLTLVTPDFAGNSLGRTYCLWLMGVALGWNVSIVGTKGRSIWPPLADAEFARACVLPDVDASVSLHRVAAAMAESDVVIAVKPLASSLGIADRLLNQTTAPLIVDVDDPDLEVHTTWQPLHRRLPRRFFSQHYRSRVALRARVARFPVMVSNPVLQRMYGGTVIPHVRPIPPAITGFAERQSPTVRFVGSVRGHKGISVLREAVRELAPEGYTLGITDAPPPDAQPWEQWYGVTTMAQGLDLVSSADIVAIPSTPGGYSPAQLPVKLIDAMAFGRPIVASDFEPIRWAMDGSGLLVNPADTADLVTALRSLRSAARREHFGSSARSTAMRQFSVPAVAPTFEAVVTGVLDVRQHSR